MWQADHPFQGDEELQTLTEKLPDWGRERIEKLADSVSGRLDAWAVLANAHAPTLERYDPFGERIDRICYHPAYREMERVAYEESGLVWLHHDSEFRVEHGRVPRSLSFALGYLFAQAEQGLYCPICLTDGTATVLSRFAEESQKQRYLPRLTSRSLKDLWQGAMFLTERAGGSDVGRNETCAKSSEDGTWRLHGRKWFCSNVDAAVALVLARPEGASAGTRGLGLYLVPRWTPEGTLNACHILRLKDKLGTRSMATGEIALEGAYAEEVVGPPGGFAAMTDMLNLSRLYNAVASVAVMRRAYAEARSHALSRIAFGRPIAEHPLCARTLEQLERLWRGAFRLVFHTIDHYDAVECTGDSRRAGILRLLTPLVKYHTARGAVRAASEAMEVFGGDGYCEPFVTTRLLRDAQVLPIWEGTTNILVLDAWRAVQREEGLEPLLEEVSDRFAKAGDRVGMQDLENLRVRFDSRSDPDFEGEARDAFDRLIELVERSLLTSTG